VKLVLISAVMTS